jgi:hypothetical protein
MKITATKGFRYAGREICAGEAFDASDRDAKILIATRKARKGEDPPQVYQSAAFKAPAAAVIEPAPVAEAEPQPAPLLEAAPEAPVSPRRRYGTRNLTAED